MKKAKVNKDLCISCGACTGIVPDVFGFGDDDKAEAKVDMIPENLEEDCVDAAEGCPTGAITIEEENEK